jgi:hypothetical protein
MGSHRNRWRNCRHKYCMEGRGRILL